MKFSIDCLAFVVAMLVVGQAFAGKNTVREDNVLRIMSFNIRNGIGMDGVADYSRTSDAINRYSPDIVAIQEIDSVTKRSDYCDVLKEVALRTRLFPVFSQAIAFDGGKYGIGMLCKESPLSCRRFALPGREESRTLLMVEFKKYICCCTHLSLTEVDRLRSLEIIREVAKDCSKPLFLVGDLNDHLDSDFIAGLRKDFVVLSDTSKLTYPADKPNETLDYIMLRKKDKEAVSKVGSFVCNEPLASDHRPVIADIIFKQPEDEIFSMMPYLQNPTGKGITIMWQTKVPSYSYVEYGLDKEHLQMARTVVDGQVICNNTNHKIRLEGLQPGKTYYYRICSRELLQYRAYYKDFGNTQYSDFYTFTLPEEGSTDFTALIFNDLHQNVKTLKVLADQIKEVDYDFVFFNGDCIDDPVDHEEATCFLNELTTTVSAHLHPVFFIRGNHEIRNAYSIGLRNLLDYVGDRTYGAFSWGDTRFIMLDCGEDKPDDHWVYYGLNDFTDLREAQVDFLKEEFASVEFKKASKRVLLHHIPIYGKGEEYGKYNLCRGLWAPVLEGASVDVSINAHTHKFSYHAPGSDGNSYPVVVGGGPSLESATVMVLNRRKGRMSLKVLNCKGEVIKQLDL